jgi:hypothetical protein
MSFYGSVYYQLIDTFYKVAIRNKGYKNYGFLSTEDLFEENESPAIGRKGIFSLDSGNYWINFSKNENNTKEAAPYKIWHSPAHNDSKTMKRVSSWDIVTDNYESVLDENTNIEIELINKNTNEDVLNSDHYVQLQEHDMLKLYESNYDEAGHIIPG